MTNKRQKEYYKEKTRYWITTIDDFEDTPYTCAVIDETCRLIKLIEAHPELAEEEYVPSEEFLEQAKAEEGYSFYSPELDARYGLLKNSEQLEDLKRSGISGVQRTALYVLSARNGAGCKRRSARINACCKNVRKWWRRPIFPGRIPAQTQRQFMFWVNKIP